MYILFIVIASSMWAVDAIFRTQLTFSIPSASIILIEHIIGCVLLAPVLIKEWSWIVRLPRAIWYNLIALAAISSVGGTIFFTQALAKSFAQKDFITPLLILKLQPVFGILLAHIFLKERLTPKFIILAICAMIGSYLISFGLSPISLTFSGKTLVYLLAICAPICWAAGTIFSKNILKQVTIGTATALRYLVSIPIALVAVYVLGQTYNYHQLGIHEIWRFLTIAGITGGAAAIYIYYKGLQKTDARVSALAELAFPLVSVVIGTTSLNPYGAPQTVSVVQIIGMVILVGTIIMIQMLKEDRRAV